MIEICVVDSAPHSERLKLFTQLHTGPGFNLDVLEWPEPVSPVGSMLNSLVRAHLTYAEERIQQWVANNMPMVRRVKNPVRSLLLDSGSVLLMTDALWYGRDKRFDVDGDYFGMRYAEHYSEPIRFSDDRPQWQIAKDARHTEPEFASKYNSVRGQSGRYR